MNKQLTTLCYLEKDGRYLMLHRTKKAGDINHDKYIGIGGHLEQGESPEDCILREAREETGYTLTRMRLRGVITFVMDDTASCTRPTPLPANRLSAAKVVWNGCPGSRCWICPFGKATG